jgi:hypothetical protein
LFRKQSVRSGFWSRKNTFSSVPGIASTIRAIIGELRWTSPHQFSAIMSTYLTWLRPLKNCFSSAVSEALL